MFKAFPPQQRNSQQQHPGHSIICHGSVLTLVDATEHARPWLPSRSWQGKGWLPAKLSGCSSGWVEKITYAWDEERACTVMPSKGMKYSQTEQHRQHLCSDGQ